MNILKLFILALLFACMVESGYTRNSVSFSAAAQDTAFTPAAAPQAAPEEVVPQGATPVGRVVWVKGDSFKAVMGNRERKLAKTSVIYLHDHLITDDNTEAEIVFTDNTLITFNHSTNFSVDDYSFAPNKAKGSVGKSIMSIVKGGFRTITGLIAKRNPPDYSMNTPVATIGVRGTDYRVQMQNGQLYIGFNEGKPCVTAKNNPQEVCLDRTKPYAQVTSANAAPVTSTQAPAVFTQEQQEEITPAKIAGFGSLNEGGGTTSSFCISQ